MSPIHIQKELAHIAERALVHLYSFWVNYLFNSEIFELSEFLNQLLMRYINKLNWFEFDYLFQVSQFNNKSRFQSVNYPCLNIIVECSSE